MSNDAFVDKLYATAGISDPATRNAMVSALNNGASRGSVVKTIAKSSAAHAAFFNRAYVLMQYFGYLRRNPDDAPNFNDLGGYNFWLGQLDNHIKTNWDMVQAFIESIEYRERFLAAPFCSAN